MSCITPDDASDDFSWSRLLTRILSITITIVGIFLLIVAGLYGASLATNLNLYRECANFSKAQQKGRRQGHMLFYFHGEYYQTGLLTINGGK